MKKSIVLIFSVVCMFIISCTTIKKSFSGNKSQVVNIKDSSSLNGHWRLTYITGPRISFEGLYPKTKPFLVLDEAKLYVSGNTGCNTFMGPFTLNGDSIQFKNLATSMKMCMEGAQGETVFLRTINIVTHYRMQGDTLWLRYKNIDAMKFVKEAPSL